MGAIASQITSLTSVYSIVYSDADQRKHQSVTGLCAVNSPGTGEFPAQMASYAENASIRWRHHELSGRGAWCIPQMTFYFRHCTIRIQRHSSFQKSDDGFVSPMRNRHQICFRYYVTDPPHKLTSCGFTTSRFNCIYRPFPSTHDGYECWDLFS